MTTPTWLNPAKEITASDQPVWFSSLNDQDKASAFIKMCMASLLKQNLSPEQALEVTANMIAETGWGRKWRGFNFGGWKINQEYVRTYKATHQGQDPLWWQAQGHIASGDQPVVYYRGFVNVDEFLEAWVQKFVPKTSDASHRYHKTGIVFWQGSPSWFLELCLAGYKGPVTAANPGPSVLSFNLIIERARVIHAQTMLNLTPDGRWGNLSKQACKTFQNNVQILPTGLIDKETYKALCLAKK